LSNITNSGDSGTILAFKNQFQVSLTNNEIGLTDTYPTEEMTPLGSVSTAGTSKLIDFPKTGTYYMRACADIPPKSPGTIKEGIYEDNNCSGWEAVFVEEGKCDNGATDYPTCTPPGNDPIDGVCVQPHSNCALGVGFDEKESINSYLWQCPGINGGNNVSCVEDKGNPDPVGDLTFTALPTWIFKGRPATLTWSSGADTSTCVGESFDTGGQPSGSVKVTPNKTTTYTISGCNKGGVDLGTKSVKVRVINPIIIEI